MARSQWQKKVPKISQKILTVAMITKYDKMIFCKLGVFWHPNDFTTFFDKKVSQYPLLIFLLVIWLHQGQLWASNKETVSLITVL